MLALRENADAVVVGAGTVRTEGYGSLGLDEQARTRRLRLGLEPEPRLVIVGHEIPASARGLDPLLLGSIVDVAELRERYPRILCEGGPTLAGSLVDVVDELCLTLSPTLAGGDAGRIIAGARGAARGGTLEHVLEEDGFLFLRYSIA
jgi:riboflavin biosynthesis pyrimidine reductase